MWDVFHSRVNQTSKCVHAPLSKPGGKVIRVSHLTDKKTEAWEAVLLEGAELDGWGGVFRGGSQPSCSSQAVSDPTQTFPRSSPGGHSSTQVCLLVVAGF